jgi:hypothetical protein
MRYHGILSGLVVACLVASVAGGCKKDDDDDDDDASAGAAGTPATTGGTTSTGGSDTGGSDTGGAGGSDTGGAGGSDTGGSDTGGEGGSDTGGAGGEGGGPVSTGGAVVAGAGGAETGGAETGGIVTQGGVAGSAGAGGEGGGLVSTGGAGGEGGLISTGGAGGEGGVISTGGAGGAGGAEPGIACPGCAVITIPYTENNQEAVGLVHFSPSVNIDLQPATLTIRGMAPDATGGVLQAYLQRNNTPSGSYALCFQGWVNLTGLGTLQDIVIPLDCSTEGNAGVGIGRVALSIKNLDGDWASPTTFYIDSITLSGATVYPDPNETGAGGAGGAGGVGGAGGAAEPIIVPVDPIVWDFSTADTISQDVSYSGLFYVIQSDSWPGPPPAGTTLSWVGE